VQLKYSGYTFILIENEIFRGVSDAADIWKITIKNGGRNLPLHTMSSRSETNCERLFTWT
jgi:hypothetical protein